MALWATSWGRALRRFAVAALVVALNLTGCGEPSGPGETTDNTKETGPAKSQEKPADGPAATNPTGPMQQTFAEATRRADDPPEDCQRPPDRTVSGKPVYKLYTEVTRLWDTIRFTTPDGKPLKYTATVETDEGDLVIALRPDVAPNHVRNFVALARAGYYDGLCFDRIYHGESDEDPSLKLEQIEAGCPLGTGEPGYGSIGYWLKPEFCKADKVTHEEGTVGACRGREADTAACRFYITLTRAPFLDENYTIFGKVTQGLDVARRIYRKPTIIDEQDRDGSRRPEKPVLIKKVTIHTES
jgi:cyclophilin family peptidyl-prolyl cis-trans isomerase